MRASEITKRPVVTLAGEDVAQVKDLVYSADGGAISGFTLNGRGRLAGPLKTGLSWPQVLGCGRDAVMIRDESALTPRAEVVEDTEARNRDVLGSRVITDTGIDLGKVVDVIVEVGQTGAADADVLGYEIEASPGLSSPDKREGRRVLIPLPDTLAVSGEALMVPAATVEFVSDDLAGFGAAVEEFRDHLKGGA